MSKLLSLLHLLRLPASSLLALFDRWLRRQAVVMDGTLPLYWSP